MFTVAFSTASAAFDGTTAEADDECARILGEVGAQLGRGEVARPIRDANGNTIGRWSRFGDASTADDRCPNCEAESQERGNAYADRCQRCGYGASPQRCSTTATGGEAVAALLTVARLRVRAANLRAGDRVVYHRDGIYRVDTVAMVTLAPWPGAARDRDVTITTEGGDRWSCSSENRSCLRVTA